MKCVGAFARTARATLGIAALLGVIDVARLNPQGTVSDALDQQKTIQFLNKAINWYQQSALQQQVSMGPSASHGSGHFYFAQTGHSHFAATGYAVEYGE